MTKNLTPAALLTILNKDARSAADIAAGSAYLKRSAYMRALWLDVRIGTDGVDNGTAADESGVTAGRVSQIRYGVTAMVRAGIPLPATTDAATIAEGTYLHVSRVYKSGKSARARLKDAVTRAETIADIAGKHSALLAVLPDTADDNKRPARPEGNNKDAHDEDMTGTPVVGGQSPDERPSTVTERLAAILADVKNGAPIADLESAQRTIDQISDLVADRAAATVDA